MSKKPTKGKKVKHWKTRLHFEVWKLIKSINWRRENVWGEDEDANGTIIWKNVAFSINDIETTEYSIAEKINFGLYLSP